MTTTTVPATPLTARQTRVLGIAAGLVRACAGPNRNTLVAGRLLNTFLAELGQVGIEPNERLRPLEIAPTSPPPLTRREMEALVGMSLGKTNAEIGRELGITEDTVRTHAHRLYKKLHARDRASAVARGFRTGLLT